MTIGKDQNKDQYQNWQVFGAWKLPFCDHRVIKLTQNCACFTNPCINVHVQSLVNATPRYLNLLPMESIHERNLLLETCEHSKPTLRRLLGSTTEQKSFHPSHISTLLELRHLIEEMPTTSRGIIWLPDQFVSFPCEWSDVPIFNH